MDRRQGSSSLEEKQSSGRGTSMFLPYVSEFVVFLSLKEHTLEEVLAHIVLRVLSPIDASIAFICELNKSNLVSNIGMYGASEEMQDRYPNLYSLDEKFPLCDAIKTRRVVWINTLPVWPTEYPALVGRPVIPHAKTFICFPIEKSGTPVAAFGLFCNEIIELNTDIETFLKSIGNLLAMYFFSSTHQESTPNTSHSKVPKNYLANIREEKLSDRQLVILRMMSEGDTNLSIADRLGYSESTIRQETIKIFAKLQCNGRVKATSIFLNGLENIG